MDIRVFLCLTIIPTIHSSDMSQWQMLTQCGQTIGQDVFSGEVTKSYLYGTTQVECQLVISPKQTSAVDSRILFYFTDIHLESSGPYGRPCEAANMTIQETDSPFSPSSGITVPGIRDTLCGDNDTLVDLVLTTRYYSNLVITLKRSSDWHSNPSSFTLKFVSFHEGPCDDDSTFTCSNERCIDNSLKCSDDVNACGDESHFPSKDFWERLQDNLKWIYIAIGLVVAYYVLREGYKRYRHDNCLKKSCIGGNANRSDSPSRRSSLPSLESRRVSLELSERRSSSASSVASETSVSSGMTASEEDQSPASSSTYAPPDYETFAPINSDLAGEDTPRVSPTAPPDYDFTPISEEEMRPAPPSYEDVIANEDIYKTSTA